MNGLRAEQREAFAAAIHALTEEPTAPNVVRYLVASRSLEQRPEADNSRKGASLPKPST